MNTSVLVTPVLCDHFPVSNEPRDGPHIGVVAKACEKRVPRAESFVDTARIAHTLAAVWSSVIITSMLGLRTSAPRLFLFLRTIPSEGAATRARQTNGVPTRTHQKPTESFSRESLPLLAHPTCPGPRVAAAAEFTLHKITAVRTSWNAVRAKSGREPVLECRISRVVAMLRLATSCYISVQRTVLIAVVSAVDPLARRSELWVNRGRSGSACGGVEIPIRRWVNIIDHRYSPLFRPRSGATMPPYGVCRCVRWVTCYLELPRILIFHALG